MLQGFFVSLHIFITMKKETLKVKANVRFIFAPTGRIYDPGNVFECSQADADYLTEHKLVDLAPEDAEIEETEQDKAERIAAGNSTEAEKLEALAVINQMDEVIEPDTEDQADTVSEEIVNNEEPGSYVTQEETEPVKEVEPKKSKKK